MSEKIGQTDPASPVHGASGRRLAVAVVVLFVVALAALLWVGWAWWKAIDHSRTASARDALLGDARQAAVYLNAFDTNDLETTFANIESVITGEQLRAEMEEARAQLETDSPTGGRISADVSDLAIVDFEPGSDEAVAVAVVLRTTSGPTGQSVTQRVMMQMQLLRVDGSWKVAQSDQVGTAALVAEHGGQEGLPELPGELAPDGDAPGAEPNGEGPAEPAELQPEEPGE
ncbi:hypothetical protein ONR57_01300 [Hoyosella sp. YIM 151337]|uniref:hypothetical protein n=1 Tax=Hoyosella sp. YIM 151337 TaxID=2992742 RepID=UPI00223558B3|nr:hypothetical protein [Hoyosella sp. YIM 151337]MCW4351935.1 hypothetical protein [Hoyosella sp. YIM 151337]